MTLANAPLSLQFGAGFVVAGVLMILFAAGATAAVVLTSPPAVAEILLYSSGIAGAIAAVSLIGAEVAGFVEGER